MGATRQLAEFVAQTAFEQLPPEIVSASKRSVLDYLGVALGASGHEAVRILAGALGEMGATPQATVLGSRSRVSTLHAAMINGTMSHVLDYDDTHIESSIHPTGPVLSAALPLAEWKGLSGKQLIASLVLGMEAELRVGAAVQPAHYDAGWHATGTAGTFGAAAAASRLLGLDGEQTAHALGLAGTQAAGVREMFGSMSKSFHVGKAAFNGLLGALLAGRGFTASPEVLEGRRGFAAVLAGQYDLSRVTEGLGSDYLQTRNGFKPYACGVVVHPAIDGVRRLREKHSLQPAQVAAIEVRVAPLVLDLTGKKEPRTGLEGKFSIYFSSAIALIEGNARESQFTDEKVNRPDVVALRGRVRAIAAPELDKSQAVVTIRTVDGRELVERVEVATGMPGNPMSEDDLVGKFVDLALPVLSREKVDRLVEQVWHLEDLDDVRRLVELVTP